jgi:hypothetical protein
VVVTKHDVGEEVVLEYWLNILFLSEAEAVLGIYSKSKLLLNLRI